jgi:hypothetical protein
MGLWSRPGRPLPLFVFSSQLVGGRLLSTQRSSNHFTLYKSQCPWWYLSLFGLDFVGLVPGRFLIVFLVAAPAVV